MFDNINFLTDSICTDNLWLGIFIM